MANFQAYYTKEFSTEEFLLLDSTDFLGISL